MYFEITDTNVRLLGTLHLFPKHVSALPRWAEDVYEWADELIFEMDWTAIGDVFTVPVGQSIERLVSPEIRKGVEKVWPAEYADLKTSPPWLVMMNLGTVGAKLKPGVDMLFAEKADKDGKPKYFLESPQEFFEKLNAIPLQDIEEALHEALKDIPLNERGMKGMYSDWARRDLATMFRRVQKKSLISNTNIREQALFARNRAWQAHVEGYLSSPKHILVLVGGLHLCQAGSLLEILGRPYSELSGKVS